MGGPASRSRVEGKGGGEAGSARRVSGAVLAGGKSRRFGRDKAEALLGGVPLIRRVLDILQDLFDDVLIVSNQPIRYASFGVPVAADVIPGAGSLGGILTALIHARNEWCFIAACDMPFLSPPVIRKMLERCGGYDVTVPVLNGEPEPLHAIYSKRCVQAIEKRIRAGDFRILHFYPEVRTLRLEPSVWRDVDPEDRSFANINTERELRVAERWMEKMRTGRSA